MSEKVDNLLNRVVCSVEQGSMSWSKARRSLELDTLLLTRTDRIRAVLASLSVVAEGKKGEAKLKSEACVAALVQLTTAAETPGLETAVHTLRLKECTDTLVALTAHMELADYIIRGSEEDFLMMTGLSAEVTSTS